MLKFNPIPAFMKTYTNFKKLFLVRVIGYNIFFKLNLKGTAILTITMFYMKYLYKPLILIPVSSKSVEKLKSYMQMDCNGIGHIVGLVTSHSLSKYA